jgi:N utilization substance protein B
MGRRRKARELALQLAYQLDLGALDLNGLEEALRLARITSDRTGDFAMFLVRGTWENLAGIDEEISRCTDHWEASRMAMVDRNILRLAAFELLFAEDIPLKTTINEWIEISKKYSTQKSGAFINGVLDHMSKGTGIPAAAREPGQAPAGKGER